MLVNVLNVESSNCTPISSCQFAANTNFIFSICCVERVMIVKVIGVMIMQSKKMLSMKSRKMLIMKSKKMLFNVLKFE